MLLIAFCFGAFFEGAAGFGTPVAVTAALLIGLGFKPLQASGLSLIANTAPVAFGALGTPIIALAKVTGISETVLAAMTGRILTPFCILVPFWLIWAFAGFSGMMEVWPAILVAGVTFAIPQLLVSNLHGPWVVNVVASVVSMACLIGFLLIWHPKKIWKFEGQEEEEQAELARGEIKQTYSRKEIVAGLASVGCAQHHRLCVGHADRQEVDEHTGRRCSPRPQAGPPSPARSPIRSSQLRFCTTWSSGLQPVVPKPTKEPAVYGLNWLSATGTGILLAAVISGLIMGQGLGKIILDLLSRRWSKCDSRC